MTTPEVVGVLPARRPYVWLLRIVGSALVGAVLLLYVMPRLLGTTLPDVWRSLSQLSGAEFVGLIVLWGAGLFVHSFVLTGALPGLSRRRALTLNLTGSAVANVLPFGGAGGIALNYVMIRSWGVSAAGFAAYTVVTNVWVVLLKLAMPALALTALLVSATAVSPTMRWTAATASVALAVTTGVLLLAIAQRSVALRAAQPLARIVGGVRGLFRRETDAVELTGYLMDCRDIVADVVRRHGWQLSFGMLGYAALQMLLLYACVEAIGGRLSWVQVLAAYAVDRVLTLAVVTPGGAGFTEAGTAAALVALGGTPATMAAGVLLYRGFTFAMEIPVGGVWLGGWLLARPRESPVRNARDQA